VIGQDKGIYDVDFTASSHGSPQGISNFDNTPINWLVENNVVLVQTWNGLTFARSYAYLIALVPLCIDGRLVSNHLTI